MNLRTTISGGGGRYLVATPRSRLYASIGLSVLRETRLNTSLSVLPSLSEAGRYRAEYAISLNRELIRDFTVSLNLNGSYDSSPPEDSKSSDTSFTINLGWSY